MNDSNVMTALECKVRNVTAPLFRPACNLCVYKHDFLMCNTLELYKDVLGLIKCQQAELELLREFASKTTEKMNDR